MGPNLPRWRSVEGDGKESGDRTGLTASMLSSQSVETSQSVRQVNVRVSCCYVTEASLMSTIIGGSESFLLYSKLLLYILNCFRWKPPCTYSRCVPSLDLIYQHECTRNMYFVADIVQLLKTRLTCFLLLINTHQHFINWYKYYQPRGRTVQ